MLIPVDEIADHAPIVQIAEVNGESARRADFIHVSAPARGPLEFRFVEVKYRRHLRTARQPDMLQHMVAQTSELRQRWMDWFFSETLAPLDRVVRRTQLAKLLRFYVDRARRHRLTDRAYARLTDEIDQLVLKDGYQPGSVSDPDVGYIFCPEHRTGQAERIYPQASDTALWLFGPTLIPDEEGIGAGRPMLPLTLGEPAAPADPADPVHYYPAMPSAFARHDTPERNDRSPREEAAHLTHVPMPILAGARTCRSRVKRCCGQRRTGTGASGHRARPRSGHAERRQRRFGRH